MRRTVMIAVLLLLGLGGVAESASDGSKGTTVDDLGRGLKSAAQNVEREIPKIGSAIGNAVKKMTDKGAEKPSTQEPSKQKK